jgi:hypothetical protein
MCVYQFRHLGKGALCSKERNYSRAFHPVKYFGTKCETRLEAIVHMPARPRGRFGG